MNNVIGKAHRQKDGQDTFAALITTIAQWDAMRCRNLATPNARLVLTSATLSGLLAIGLWLGRGRMAFVHGLFAKEGPFEDLTFVLELVGAFLCLAAAWRWNLREPKPLRLVPPLYAGLGLLLFLVAMEEINWGQTLLGFDTPAVWSRINYQHETSIHNLVSKEVLTETWRIVAALFGAGVLAIVVLSVRFPRSIAGALSPPPALVPLALCASYAGLRLHPEMIELLISVFFAFYGYRIWIAARSTTRPRARTSGVASPHVAPHGAAPPSPGGWTVPGRVAIRYVVAGLLLALLLYRVDWHEARQAASRLQLWPLAGAFVAMWIGLVASAWKWRWALRMHDLHYPYPFLLRVLCIGFFLNSFLPTAVGGDAYRVIRTLPQDRYRSRALSAVIVERAMGFLALIILGGLGALRLAETHELARQYWYILLILAASGTAGIIALQGGWLAHFAPAWRRLPALNAVRHNISLLRGRRIEWMGLIAGSFGFQLISIGIIFVLFSAVTTNATPSQCALIAAAVGVAAALPVSVNGIGIMEGAMVTAAVALNLDYEQALIVAFARRALAVCVALPCGVLWLVEARHLPRANGQRDLASLVRTFRRDGLRGLLQTLLPPGPAPWTPAVISEATLAEPDVPLSADPHDVERGWWDTQLLEYTHDAIIIWEMNGEGIRYWNRAAEQLYGYTREEAHGRTTHELLKTTLAGGVPALEASLARFGVWVGELRHTTRHGRQVHVEGRLALMSQLSGRWLVLEVNRDITDRKTAEDAHRAMERQLAELRVLHKSPSDADR